MVKIHEEIRELLNKQVHVQIEYLPGFMQAHTEVPKKCAMKMEEDEEEEEKKKKKKKKKKMKEMTGHLKIILMKGGLYKALLEKQLDGSQRISGY